MNTVFLGVDYHFKNTKSSQFFIDILKHRYSDMIVTGNADSLLKLNIDTLILWQVLPSPEQIDYYKAKNVILCPMYDDCPHVVEDWNKYKKYKIFCFSKTLFELLNKNGFECFYSQYYIKPEISNTQIKDLINVFFWERYEKLNWSLVGKVCEKIPITHLHFHTGLTQNSDLSNRPSEIEVKKYNINFTSWFEHKEEMTKILNNTQIYFAPRKSEGIGMSFIEALAAGSVVVAYDFSTMNEYITPDEDGILYDENNLPKGNYTKEKLIEIQKKSILRAQKGYEKWVESIPSILNFFEKPLQNYNPKRTFKMRSYYFIKTIKKIIKIIIFYDFWKKKN